LIPALVAAFYSLTDWNGIRRTFEFVGIANYARALSDPLVLRSFGLTFALAATTTVVVNSLALPIAAMIVGSSRINTLYRSIVFYPIVLSAVVAGFIGQAFFATNGIINQALTAVGLGKIPFLAEPRWALISIGILAVWQSLGLIAVLYLAGLKGISKELYEAARVDGASSVALFRHITLPLIAPVVTLNVVFLFVVGMRQYDYVVVMTGGGPAGGTATLAWRLVDVAFNQTRYAYGSAIGITLLLVVTIMSIPLLAGLRRRETVS